LSYLSKCLIASAAVLLIFAYIYVYIKKQKRTAEKCKTAVNDLKLVQELGKEISSKLQMSELLPAIMDAFVKAGDVSKGSLMLYDRERDILEIHSSVGLSDRARKYIKLKIGEGIAGRVAETGKPILVNDTTGARMYKDFFSEDSRGRPQETILSMPLIFKGEVLGVITLDAKKSGGQFIRNDERLLSILALQAAVSINNARMYEMAITDDLTKLYSKRHFIIRLQEEVEKARRYDRPLSLLFVDIDHFKEFNDTYGHQLGDRALQHLGGVIKKTTRAADISGRYGGEEFVIILPETARESALILAERLRKNIEKQSFVSRGNEYRITVSIGIGEYKAKMTSPSQLISEADKNLYKAKQKGRNRVV